MSPSTKMNITATANAARSAADSLEKAGRTLEKHMNLDSNFPRLTQLMHLSQQCFETHSGLNNDDYRSMQFLAPGTSTVKQLVTTNKVSLPPEIMEHFAHMQCHCMMGLFPEIRRAWLTIDSDVYIWSYEHGTDLAYYDGLSEVIISVGLVKPKPGVFFPYVKYLLVLTTMAEIVVLGVRFSSTSLDGPLGALEAMHLLPEPIFVVPTEGISITTISCSDNGRLFLGGRDGSLFEIEYRAERSWFGKRFNKKNHSTGYLSYLMPSFLSAIAYGEEDAVVQIAVDNSRQILYTLSERGSIEVWDLGESGQSMSRVATASQAHIVQCAVNIVKTLDAKCVRPIVHIAALGIADSRALHLVAVARTGVRFYFTTMFPQQRSLRPAVLALQHVRVPPGFAANSPSYPPASTTLLHYSRGSLVMVTAPGGDKDELWCLSKDLFPWSACVTEAQTIVPLDGKVWAICEEPQKTLFDVRPNPEMTDEEPPLVVRQHMEPSRKYVLLTAQGAQLVSKLRPVDILRQILMESQCADAESVKTFFVVQGEEQACASALVLACLEANTQVADWATRAFFLYGGEPKTITTGNIIHNPISPPAQGTPYQFGFNPGLSSTPRGQTQSSPPGIGDPTSMITYSAKHNSLYLHVCRILRPFWTSQVVLRENPSGKKPILSSTVTSDHCVLVLQHLIAVKTFLEKNSQFTTNFSAGLLGGSVRRDLGHVSSPDTPGWSQRTITGIDAQLEEKSSLCALKAFVAHACEVIGLWKLLCEHQFHVIADMLDKDIQNYLPNATFRDVLLAGHSLCSLFINSLINSYLGDCASVDSISAKLREVCPNLYRNEDAACSKANELLIAAKKTNLVDEKEAKLKTALNLCKEVAPQIDLPLICQQFASNQFYAGVLQLCLTCANKQDPGNVALHWYKNNEPPEDVDGYNAYVKRMETYKQLTLVLDQLYQVSVSAPGIPASPLSSLSTDTSSLRPADAQAQAKRLVTQALTTDDELLHLAVLEWMLRQDLHGELIAVDSPSVETFLTRASVRNPDAADLLWKYYERHGNHAAAAKLLHQLASTKGRQLSLAERIGHLARAVMCMRGDKVGSAPHLGVFLQELEEKMEVAVIQQKVLEAVRNMQGRHQEVDAAVMRLNSELLSCTDLYEQFADPLQLWECKLAIVHSTNHNDPELVEDIWQNIVASEVRRHVTWSEKLEGLSGRVGELAKEFGQTPRCFPLPFIVRALEVVRCKGRCEQPAFLNLLAAGVAYLSLLQVYETLATCNDRTWAMEGNEFHVMESIADLANYFTENPSVVSAIARKGAVTKTLDLISRCLVILYAKTGTEELIVKLKAVESKLKRMGGF